MDVLKSLDIPAAIAAILVLTRWFLDDRRKDREMMAAADIKNRALWENHLSKSVSVQEKTSSVLEKVVDELRLLNDRLR